MKKVVICGSFHRDIKKLHSLFNELEAAGCRILSPLSLDFEDLTNDFVIAKSESGLSTLEIEKFHLRAIDEADFVWLHAPDGYVGISASFEIGYAIAKNKKVFCFEPPTEEIITNYITVKHSVFSALETTYF